MFLLESLLLGLLGTVAGAAAGALIAAGINAAAHRGAELSAQLFLMSDHLHLAVHAERCCCGRSSSSPSCTALAALYPLLAGRAPASRSTAMPHFG